MYGNLDMISYLVPYWQELLVSLPMAAASLEKSTKIENLGFFNVLSGHKISLLPFQNEN